MSFQLKPWCLECGIEMGTDSNGTVYLWRGSHHLVSALTGEKSIQKNSETLRRRSVYFKVLCHYMGLTLQCFLFNTVYRCCVERYVSDIQNIRRLLGFVLLFLRFVKGHRQTHEDFGTDCRKKAEESYGRVLIALCQSVESAFLDLIILSTMWKLKGKEPALAPKLYKPNRGCASQSAWEEDCCWLLQHAFGFLDGFVVVTTQEPELVNSSGSFKAGSGQTCHLCQVSLVFEESSQEFFI